jgi:colanic acid biosynthesis glycosyl transferase WcaI
LKILILTPAFPPEITGSGHLMYELAETLSKNGHVVTIITAIPRQRMGDDRTNAKYKGKFIIHENLNGIKVIRPTILPLPLTNPITKGLDHFSLAASYYLAGRHISSQDIVFVYSPPLTLGLTGIKLAKRFKAPLVFNAQDMFPQYAIDTGVLRNRVLIKIFEIIEQYVYRSATCITVHSEGNLSYLSSRGISRKKIKVIFNWVDTERFRPSERYNEFRKEYGFDDKFIVSYAGTLGWAQGLDTVMQSAKMLKGKTNILFLIVGEGPRKKNLENNVIKERLENVVLLQLLPRDKYAKMMQASDICLISLSPKIKTPVVPGKLFDIMACGRPVIGNVPPEGDAFKIVQNAQCGICVPPDDAAKLAEAILKLYEDAESASQMGMNGRRIAEKLFSRAACTKAYEQLLLSLLSKT